MEGRIPHNEDNCIMSWIHLIISSFLKKHMHFSLLNILIRVFFLHGIRAPTNGRNLYKEVVVLDYIIGGGDNHGLYKRSIAQGCGVRNLCKIWGW